MNLAGLDHEVDIVVGDQGSEALCQVDHFEQTVSRRNDVVGHGRDASDAMFLRASLGCVACVSRFANIEPSGSTSREGETKP